jgi:hypothetical protein
MKKNFLTLLLLVFISVIVFSCKSKNNGANQSSGNTSGSDSSVAGSEINALPVLSFEEDFHDFGKLYSGELVTYAFKFKNTGKSMLLISNVGTSCGCTVTAFPKQPIKPGEESTIDVKFDTTGKHGRQSKSITVFANTQPPTSTLRIEAFLVESEDI